MLYVVIKSKYLGAVNDRPLLPGINLCLVSHKNKFNVIVIMTDKIAS